MIDPVKQIIIVRRDLITKETNPMTPGKMGAQIAHASLAPILEKMYKKPFVEYQDTIDKDSNYTLKLNLNKGDPLKIWLERGFTKIVLYVKSEEKLLTLHQTLLDKGIISCLIVDEGRTIFGEPTTTCLGIEPLPSSVIDPLTKKLRLLI